MAKGSAMGLWRGKKGSSVFYKIKNSNSLQKQGIRERIYEVANPQSNAQCAQRMRLLPAQHVYGAIKDVIERSWQGVKYGEMSRQAFLKGALALGTDVPFLKKNEAKAIPGAYQIAKGSLQEVICTLAPGGAFFATSLAKETTAPSTWGQLATQLLNNNSSLKEGDQVSLIYCSHLDDVFSWNVISFFLDPSSVETIPSDLGGATFDLGEEYLILSLTTANINCAAAACIISREGSTPQRSNATLTIDKTVMSKYFSEAARILALTSYKKASVASSTDWPVDPEVEPADPTKANVTITYNDTLGSVTGAGQYNIGDSVTVTATPTGYSTFVGWYLGSTRVSQSQSYTFTIEANTALEARFQEQA